MFKKKEVLLLHAGNLWDFGAGMLGPLFAVFTEKIGGSILDITWAWATYLLVTGTLIIFIGKLSDKKIKKEKLLTIGYALNAVFTFGYLLVSSPFHLFFLQAGLGIATALVTPSWQALYAKYEDKKHDGYTWGMASGSSNIVTAIGIIIGGMIVAYASFKALFITMGIIQTIAAIYQAKILNKK